MKYFFLIFILLVSAKGFVQTSPEWFVYEGTPSAGRFDDLFFINDSVGWAVSSEGEIFKTSNAGILWELKFSSDDYFRSVEFFDSEVGFVGSLFSKLYKTIDGGESWEDISDLLPMSFDGICGMSVADDSTIYIDGVWSGPAYIFKSEDRGNSWEYMDMSDKAYSLVDIKFLNKNQGYATGQSANLDEGGIILYTNDGGLNWEVKKITDHPNDYVWKIQFLEDNTHVFGAIANVAGGFSTRFLKSTDYGNTWDVKLIDPDYYYIEMCGFMNKDTGWTGSYDCLETFDGGETWHLNNFGYNFNRFFKVNQNLAFATASTIHVYSDTNYVAPVDTTDTISIVQINKPAQHFISIQPNPSLDKLEISISLEKRTMIDLNVFDLNGHLVGRIYHGRLDSGLHHEIWNHQLPSGEYSITLHSNEGLIWEKFIVQ